MNKINFNAEIWRKISYYFERDYPYKTIIHLLLEQHNIHISLRSLTRILKKLNLKRKNLKESPREHVAVAILLEMEGSGYNLGYRAMWKRLRKVYKLIVKQKTILNILREIDPEGVEVRSRYKLKRRQYTVPGPNYLWHADNNDKLKKFGFAFYGCIDGFSRKIIWLEVSRTNNDPQVIAYYYLQTIKKLNYLPTLMRADRGTEASIMEDLQCALRYEHKDEYAGLKSFLRGKSTSNQRIESYWRQFRQRMTDFYIDLFKSMEKENLLNTDNPFHIECLRYCFYNIIKEDVLCTVKEWNEHRVRNQNNKNVLGGIPNELYHWPEKFRAQDYKKPVNEEHLQILMDKYTKKPEPYSPEIKEIVSIIKPNHRISSTIEDAYNLYLEIIYAIPKICE